MYKFIVLVGFFVRFIILPNPFESLQNGILINFAAEPVIHAVTFGIVGLFYSRGSEPSIGSFLYLVFYCINIGLILLWSILGATVIAGVLLTAVYVSILFWIHSRVNEF